MAGRERNSGFWSLCREGSDMFEEIENSWTESAGDYDDIVKQQLADRKDVLHWTGEIRSLLGKNPKRILDVGCGPGFLTIICSRLGHDVKAIDGSVGMVSCANGNFRAEGIRARAFEEDAVLLPDEENNSYDVIISRDVVWTLYDPEKAFERWKEVLKPGGLVLYYDGDYRKNRNSLKIRIWKKLSAVLIFLTERKIYPEDTDEPEGVFAKLPFIMKDRPREDLRVLKKAGYAFVWITDDAYRNDPVRMEFWKYGYQGRKFRVMAQKRPVSSS